MSDIVKVFGRRPLTAVPLTPAAGVGKPPREETAGRGTGRGGALQWGLGSSFRTPTVAQLQRSGMSVAKWGK